MKSVFFAGGVLVGILSLQTPAFAIDEEAFEQCVLPQFRLLSEPGPIERRLKGAWDYLLRAKPEEEPIPIFGSSLIPGGSLPEDPNVFQQWFVDHFFNEKIKEDFREH